MRQKIDFDVIHCIRASVAPLCGYLLFPGLRQPPLLQPLNLPLFSALFHFQNVIFAPFAPSLHKSESLIRIPATPRTTRGWIPLFLSNLPHQAYSVSASISSDRKAACISAVSSLCGAMFCPDTSL